MKRTLTGIVAASMVLGTMAPAAFASTTASFTSGGGKTISLDGTTLYNGVQVGNALDAGTTTTYFPIWYLEQALTKAGYTTSYNATTATWDITMPGTDASKISVDGGVGTGNAAISINGVVVKKFNAQWQKDLAGGANASVTTYFPLYYLSKVLSASGFSNAWDGFNFAFTKYVAPSFAVSSVTAVNGGQLLVKFNKAVDSTSAVLPANYSLKDAAGSVAFGTPVLQADGMSVILPLTTAVANSTSDDISVTVANVALSTDTTATVPTFSTVVHVADTTAPTITGVTSSTNGSTAANFTVNFSEPVAANAAIKLDGVYVGPTTLGTSTTITTSVDATKPHTIQIVNLTDAAGNITPLATSTFSVSVDKTLPTVTSVVAKGDNALLVTFSKSVTLASVQTAIPAGTSLKSETFGNVTTTAAQVVTAGATTTDTQFLIPVTDAALYTSTQTSRNLTLVIGSGVTDTLGNATTTAVTKAVTLSEDKTAPVITGMTYNTNGLGQVTGVVLNLSKGVNGAAVTTSGITVVDPNGVDVTSTFLAASATTPAAGATSVVVPLKSGPATETGVYTFTVPASIISDSSFSGNKNAASTFTVNFGTGAAAPSISVAGATAAADKITVDFGLGNAVKGGAVAGSATNAGDYTLNGSALPVGTTITLDSSFRYAYITLPAGTVAKSDTNAIFTANGILTTAGGTVKPYTGTVSIVDNTAPTLTGAVENADQTVTVSFSETLATAPVAADFTITDNGTALASATDYTVAPGVGADAGKWVITFATGKVPAAGHSIVITTTGNTGADAASNKIAAGGTATVTAQ